MTQMVSLITVVTVFILWTLISTFSNQRGGGLYVRQSTYLYIMQELELKV